MEQHAGAGVFFNQAQREAIPLGKWVTVFQAEAVAIEAATNLPVAKDGFKEAIKIWSDSQASLKALASPVVKSRLILRCQTALQALSQKHTVELVWVPGHRGIDGNEAANQLA